MSGEQHNMEIVLASRNAHKIKEIGSVLGRCGLDGIKLLSLDDIGFTGEIDETGATFAENAVIKASVPASMGYVSIADDSGLEVEYLDGEPGVYSARYAGEPCNDDNNNRKLLEKLDGVPKEKRGAKFVSVIAFVCPSDHSLDFTVRGECPGEILTAGRGYDGFGYDPLFYLPELGKTYAEISTEEKNAVSHRGKAMRLFAERLLEMKR